MKIARVSAKTYKVPVPVPLRDKPASWQFTIVEVEADNGLKGHGLTGPRLSPVIAEFINYDIAPFLVGYDPMETERIWRDLYTNFNARAVSGVWSSGVSAVDIALWDLKGKYLNQSVARLLGGAYQKVPAYITYGLAEFNTEELVEVAKILVGQGHDKLKVVVGGYKHPLGTAQKNKDVESFFSTVKHDALRVRAVREAVGPDVEIMIDANYMFNYTEALELCQHIEDLNITWFEEPVQGNDFLLLKELKKHTNIPLSAGQNFGHQWQHRELIVQQAIDISQPNVCHVGGYTEGLKVANLARAFNLKIANGGGWPHYNLHLQAGVSNGWRVEYHWLHWKACEVVFDNAPAPEAGWATIPDAPGLGFTPNPDALAEYVLSK
jgi:L-alanine-DL-glutamate epimerase-like enolase superfamily enzyme